MTKIVNCYVSQINQPARTKSFDLRYFNYVLFGMVMALGVCYLVNISDLTTQGFKLRDLKSQMAEQASDNMAIQEQVNQAQSYLTVNSRSKSLNMVAVGDVEYLTVNSSTLAKK